MKLVIKLAAIVISSAMAYASVSRANTCPTGNEEDCKADVPVDVTGSF